MPSFVTDRASIKPECLPNWCFWFELQAILNSKLCKVSKCLVCYSMYCWYRQDQTIKQDV